MKILHYPLQVQVDAGQVWSQKELNDPVTVLVHKSAIFVLQKWLKLCSRTAHDVYASFFQNYFEFSLAYSGFVLCPFRTLEYITSDKHFQALRV